MADINLGVGGANSASGGYDIDNSLKFEDDNFEWIDSGTSTSTTSNKIGTISFWFKRTELTGADQWIWSGASSARYVGIRFDSNEKLKGYFSALGNGADFVSTQVFRDTSAWYHIVLAIDTTNSTAGDRFKIYVNGERITDWDTTPAIDQNTAIEGFEASARQAWAQYNAIYSDDAVQVSGYLAETYFINGQQLAASSFGEFDSDTGIWIPKEYTGTFGDKGYYLKFDNSSSLGADSSGNGNNFTLNNIAAADQATDTPTNNFSVMNPLHNYYNEVSRFTITEGGTSLTGNQSNTLWRGIPSTFAPSNGKWYWEIERGYNGNGLLVGVGSADTGQTEWAELTSIANPSTKAKMMYSYNGGIYGYNSSTDAWQYSSNFNVIGDVQSFAIDLDNGYMYVRHNGAAWIGSGDPSSGSSGTGGIALPWYDSESTVFIVTVPNNNQDCRVNFGGYTTTANTLAYSDSNNYGAFKYEVPTGYYALCTKNLAEYG